MFHPSDHNVEMKEEEFRLLRDFVHDRFGLFFPDNQRGSLRARLAGRLAALDLGSFEDYFHYLRFGPGRAAELARLASYLTNNETYFYRERAQLDVFADAVLRSVKDRKSRDGDRTLRILSAGCSSGEEPYTLAMIVYDSGQFFWSWDVRVTGLDVDEAALDKARRATYHRNSFRSVPPAVVDRHFLRTPGGLTVKEPIRRLVSFRQANLVDAEAYAGLAPLDAIFCRNVLIYFSDAMIRRVAALFHDALAPGGHLFLGHAESLSRITDRFVPVRFQGAMAYRRPDGAEGSP
jgi:chemotaxis protein methyltransferase CheR